MLEALAGLGARWPLGCLQILRLRVWPKHSGRPTGWNQELIVKKRGDEIRPDVKSALQASKRKFDALYREHRPARAWVAAFHTVPRLPRRLMCNMLCVIWWRFCAAH